MGKNDWARCPIPRKVEGLQREWEGLTQSGAQIPAAPATVSGERMFIVPLGPIRGLGRRTSIVTRSQETGLA